MDPLNKKQDAPAVEIAEQQRDAATLESSNTEAIQTSETIAVVEPTATEEVKTEGENNEAPSQA